MRHDFTRQCVTLGSALAIGLAAFAANAQAQPSEAEPKQKALVSFKMNFLSRFKKDEKTAEAAAASSPSPSAPASSSAEGSAAASSQAQVIAASAVEPLPSGTAKTHAVAAVNSHTLPPAPSAQPLPSAQPVAPAQPLARAAAQGEFPSVMPPSVAPVQLASGQYPLPPAGQMPFQTAQSPVVLMMPAGWQPDGNYTFAPRTVMSPEVPAEHWPTSQRNPLGDDSNKGLFNWPQIARKITNSTVGEPEVKPRAPEPAPSTSRALFAGAAAPVVPQSVPAVPQAMPQAMPMEQVAGPMEPVAMPTPPQAVAVPPQALSVAAPATPAVPPAGQAVAAVESQPASKALFAPQPKPEPQPEPSKTRALLSLLSKPMTKPQAAPTSTAGSKALFAFGQKKAEPTTTAPAPAVVPQYATDTPMPPDQTVEPVSQSTMEPVDPEFQPPAPPSVAHPLPGKLHTVKSDDPKMKWRAKGMAAVAESTAMASDVAAAPQPEPAAAEVNEVIAETNSDVAMSEMAEPAEASAPEAVSTQPAHRHVQHQPAMQVQETTPVSRERSLLGKQFPTMSSQTSRNTNDSRSPWRRQAERDAVAAAEKQVEQPTENSKAILPNVAALFPAVEKPSRPVHQQPTTIASSPKMMSPMAAPARTAPAVTMVAATESTTRRPHAVQRAHETSARSTDSYYAAPWEAEVEAELNAIERRQIGAVSNRRTTAANQNEGQQNESAEKVSRSQVDREVEAVERQPRVPFEMDELEQEKSALRRSTKAAKAAAAATPKSSSPAGSPSNGARMAEQQSKKSYRRLTGSDMKQKLTRPLTMFGDMTKLPSPLKAAADGFERRRAERSEESTDEYQGEEEDAEQLEREPSAAMGDDDGNYEQTTQPLKPKRAVAKREPVHELRQSTAAAASVAELGDDERLTRGDARPATLGQRGGRRQVESTVRSSRSHRELAEQEEADADVVTADEADDRQEEEEEEVRAEASDERPVRPAMHIRNKHGNRVKIFTGDAATEGSAE